MTEVKLNDSWADEAARNLMALKDKVDPEGMRPLSFLAVVTADGAASPGRMGPISSRCRV